MQVDRKTVLAKLTAYLQQEASAEEIHSWALSVITSDEFASIAEHDPLLRSTVQALIDVHHDDLKRIPTHKALEYYRRCLAGNEEFQPLRDRKDLKKLNIPDIPHYRVLAKKERRRREYSARILLTSKIYAFLFGCAIVGLFILSLIKPELLHFGDKIPSPTESLQKSLPFLLHALWLLLPARFLARGIIFYPSFLIFVLGMFFYLFIPFIFVIKYELHWVFVILAYPFSAVPAILALFLLMVHWEEARQKKRHAQ